MDLLENLEMTSSNNHVLFLIFLMCLIMHKLMQSFEDYMSPCPRELNDTHLEEDIEDFE